MNPSIEAYVPEPSETFCRYDGTSEKLDLQSHLEQAAAKASEEYCASQLKKLAPLAELDFTLTEQNTNGSEQELNYRDATLLEAYGELSKQQKKYAETPGTQPIIDFIEIYKQKMLAVMATRPLPRFLN